MNNRNYMSYEDQLRLAMHLSMQESQRSAENVGRTSARNPATQGSVGMEPTVVREHVAKRDTRGVNQENASPFTYTIQVRKGDLTKEKTEVIVNAANGMLQHASGLAGAIVKQGGYAIQLESDKIIEERNHLRLPEGSVVHTSSGSLPCKVVFHAVGPMWSSSRVSPVSSISTDLSSLRDAVGGDLRREDVELRDSVINSLKLAHDMKLNSIAIPAISSGIFGFPKPRCATILFHTVLQWMNTSPDSASTTLKTVHFTNFDDETVNIFAKEFDKLFQ